MVQGGEGKSGDLTEQALGKQPRWTSCDSLGFLIMLGLVFRFTEGKTELLSAAVKLFLFRNVQIYKKYILHSNLNLAL